MSYGAAAAPTGAMCGDHPDVAARAICERCGKFVCAKCMKVKPRGVFCPPCSERFLSNIDGSWTAIMAAIFSFVSLGCGPLGLLAIGFAIKDIVMIRANKAPPGGMKLDAMAIVLGAIGVLIGFAIVMTRLRGPTHSDYDY